VGGFRGGVRAWVESQVIDLMVEFLWR
jgi:hypothetical protein